MLLHSWLVLAMPSASDSSRPEIPTLLPTMMTTSSRELVLVRIKTTMNRDLLGIERELKIVPVVKMRRMMSRNPQGKKERELKILPVVKMRKMMNREPLRMVKRELKIVPHARIRKMMRRDPLVKTRKMMKREPLRKVKRELKILPAVKIMKMMSRDPLRKVERELKIFPVVKMRRMKMMRKRDPLVAIKKMRMMNRDLLVAIKKMVSRDPLEKKERELKIVPLLKKISKHSLKEESAVVLRILKVKIQPLSLRVRSHKAKLRVRSLRVLLKVNQLRVSLPRAHLRVRSLRVLLKVNQLRVSLPNSLRVLLRNEAKFSKLTLKIKRPRRKLRNSCSKSCRLAGLARNLLKRDLSPNGNPKSGMAMNGSLNKTVRISNGIKMRSAALLRSVLAEMLMRMRMRKKMRMWMRKKMRMRMKMNKDADQEELNRMMTIVAMIKPLVTSAALLSSVLPEMVMRMNKNADQEDLNRMMTSIVAMMNLSSVLPEMMIGTRSALPEMVIRMRSDLPEMVMRRSLSPG